MKNFKRVISAVIALALSASTLVAVSAAKFTDVDSTNSYAEAIESLAALDIVSGYEDGSFNPDGDITRAEAARMIVSALNMNADAAASAGTTQFADVNEKASWATGFVNVGVAQGYIHGYDETSFGPQDPVTFAQMCVMLTTITGYGDYAASTGGYPTGYMAMASSAGINKGVALAAETPLKRGQVAQMVYNGVTAPMLDITTYKFDGNEYGKMDGVAAGSTKKTLLSERFDAVEVKAVVKKFEVGKTELDYEDDNYYNKSVLKNDFAFAGGTESDVIVDNDINLSNYIEQQIKAILKLDSNKKVHLVYAEGTNAVETKEIEATSKYTSDFYTGTPVTNTIKFGTQKETFTTPVTFYVNGKKFATSATLSDTQIQQLLGNAVGTIKLAKVKVGTTTPSDYNTVLMEGYEIAQVRNVEYLSGKTTVNVALRGKNNISSNFGTAVDTIEITDNNIANGSVKLDVTLDGEAIELKDLQKNDIIAIKTKMTNSSTGAKIDANKKDISILVSREIVSGKVTEVAVDDDDNKFTVGGEDYASVDKVNVKLDLTKTYNTIYLDPFGRIAAFNDEEIEESHNYAILAKVDDGEATFVLADGSTKTYEVKDSSVFPDGITGSKVTAVDSTDEANVLLAPAPTTANPYPVSQCVVDYTLKNGKINSIVKVAPEVITDGTIAKPEKYEYRSDVLRIGSIGVNSSTNIIDVSDDVDAYKKYKGMSVSQLVDGEKYAGLGYGNISGTSVYALVILTDAGYPFGAGSRFAVLDATDWSQGLDADGDAVWQLNVLLNGKKTTLDVSPTYQKAHTTLGGTRGDAFFYTTDSDGLVDDINWIGEGTITGGAVTLATAFGTAGEDYDDTSTKWHTGSVDPQANTTASYRLLQGVVVKVGTNSVSMITMPTATDAPVNINKYQTFTLDDDCLVYTYNKKAEEEKDKLNANGSLIASDFSDWKITEQPSGAETNYPANNSNIASIVWVNAANASDGTVTWSTDRGIKAANKINSGKYTEKSAQYAMALVIDNKVVEIYEIIQ